VTAEFPDKPLDQWTDGDIDRATEWRLRGLHPDYLSSDMWEAARTLYRAEIADRVRTEREIRRRLPRLSADAETGARVRAGGRRGAAHVNRNAGTGRDQERAVVAFYAASFRQQNPEIKTRELARLLSRHPKVREVTRKSEHTIRAWLTETGSSAPRRSTR
jgi:hypothetical protein